MALNNFMGMMASYGAPNTIRTCDLPLRRGTLYPAELPGQALRPSRIIAGDANRATIFIELLVFFNPGSMFVKKIEIDNLGFEPLAFQVMFDGFADIVIF